MITGWVYISESVPGNITNLNGLSAITSIGVSLYIVNNTALTSFSGLDNLTSTGTYLTCINNDALTSFSGLEKVASIGGQLNINGNDALASISGLNTLASIGGDLTISNNPMLTSLTGLDNINPGTIPNLILQNNSLLSTCEVASICSYLSTPANTATISGNVACACNSRSEIESACSPSCPPGGSITLTTQTDIDNFSCNYVGCTALTGNLSIEEAVSGNITNLNGLTVLTFIGGDLKVNNNTSLTSLSGVDWTTSPLLGEV